MARLRRKPKAASPAPNPRKTTSGTSYSASGILPTPTTDLEAGSSQGTRIQELVPELVSSYQRTLTYARMMNDAGVDTSIRIAKTPVLGAEFFMEPAGDGNDPQNQLISDFIWDNLTNGMSSPLLNSMEDILRMYEDGYAVLEKVFELREWSPTKSGANTKKYTMLKKMGLRPASTLTGIVYDDNGGPISVTQQAIKGDGKVQEVVLPIDKMLIFTFNRKGGDLTGKSLLRTAYAHWYYKTHFYKIDAIQKERHGIGVPRGKLLPGYTKQDKEILRTLLSNLRTNEEAFIMQTPNVEIDFAEVTGNLVNVLESAAHHNMMIMMNVMAQFMVLGVDGTGGGRATAGSQSDIFMKSLKFVANYICDVINMYLIPELVVYNFKSTNFPKLSVRNIGDTRDLQMFGSALANLFAQGALVGDLPTENWIRRMFDMPAKQENAVNYVQPGAQLPSSNSNGNAPAPAPAPAKGNVKPGTGAGNVGKPKNAPN